MNLAVQSMWRQLDFGERTEKSMDKGLGGLFSKGHKESDMIIEA